jgi:hypothetical protein
MRNNGRLWKKEDEDFIRDNFLQKGNIELAKTLIRSVSSIESRLIVLDLHRPKEWNSNRMKINNPLYNPITRKKLSKTIIEKYKYMDHPNKGRKMSIESILKRSATIKRLYKEGKLVSVRKGKENKWGKHTQEYKDLMRIKHMGEKNPSWKGGTSFESYSFNFNKLFKENIRQRDNLTCLKCNLFQDDNLKIYKCKLIIHHIDYNKKNTIPENCCAVCRRCNAEVNFNRNHWTKFFQSLLSERYGYNYSENGDMIINLKEVLK